jgi:actin, other eukaryote
MSLFATGRTTGTVLDSGEGITHAVPIYEGYAIPHAIQTINLCGKDLTQYLHTLLCDKHENLRTDEAFDMAQAKNIKETMCMVAQDFDAELKSATEHSSIEQKY